MDYEEERKKIKSEAAKYGFTADWNQQRGWNFLKNNTHIWYCRRGWAVAELIDYHFINHRYYPSIGQALKNEGKNS